MLGRFEPVPEDEVPHTGTGHAARAVFVVGSLSNALFEVFASSPEAADGLPDPLDRFTRRVLTGLAESEGLGIVFPFEGPPYHPFQRWTLRAGGFSRSPMGVLAHREFGPWAGLRAAFLSSEPLAVPAASPAEGPCPACSGTPCMSACPAGALSEAGYDVPRCLAYLRANPAAPCHAGCLARHACPFGRAHAQSPEAGSFHMRSFVG
nr:hypothetical protein [Stappia sp. WLB 29]